MLSHLDHARNGINTTVYDFWTASPLLRQEWQMQLFMIFEPPHLCYVRNDMNTTVYDFWTAPPLLRQEWHGYNCLWFPNRLTSATSGMTLYALPAFSRVTDRTADPRGDVSRDTRLCRRSARDRTSMCTCVSVINAHACIHTPREASLCGGARGVRMLCYLQRVYVTYRLIDVEYCVMLNVNWGARGVRMLCYLQRVRVTYRLIDVKCWVMLNVNWCYLQTDATYRGSLFNAHAYESQFHCFSA